MKFPLYSFPLAFAFSIIANVENCNITTIKYNTGALEAVGGKTAGLTMSISTLQLGVCAVYSIILWVVGINPAKLCGLQMPSRQPIPSITLNDFIKTIPVGAFFSAAHSSSVFAFSGDPLFGQIVKSGEPVLSALMGFLFYSKRDSFPKLMCLPVIVGGVAFASLKKDSVTQQ
jgi:solute carrier family 35, member E1